MGMVSHTGNIRITPSRHSAQPWSVFGPYWALSTGRHSAGRHSATHPVYAVFIVIFVLLGVTLVIWHVNVIVSMSRSDKSVHSRLLTVSR